MEKVDFSRFSNMTNVGQVVDLNPSRSKKKKIAFIRVLLLLVLHETTNLLQQIRFRFMNAY